jgi:site-specific recombinase XerC
MDAHSSSPRQFRPTAAEHPLTPTSTVGDFLEHWLQEEHLLWPSTYASYKVHVQSHLIPYLGNLPLAGLRPAHIDRMYRLIAQSDSQGETPATIASLRRLHATLATALSSAVKQGMLATSPAARVQPPCATKPRPERPEEPMVKFLATVRVDDAPQRVIFAAASWIDAIDILHLRYGDNPQFVLTTDNEAVHSV